MKTRPDIEARMQGLKEYTSAFHVERWCVKIFPRKIGCRLNLRIVECSVGDLCTEAFVLRLTTANFAGCEIFGYPIPNLDYRFILLDDLTIETLDQVQLLRPCAITRTSQKLFQAWLRVPSHLYIQANFYNEARKIARRFRSDLKAIRPLQPGRFPMFSNLKWKRKTAAGEAPLATLIMADDTDAMLPFSFKTQQTVSEFTQDGLH